jgi:hypothetical protein
MRKSLQGFADSSPIFASLGEALLLGYEFYDEGTGGYLIPPEERASMPVAWPALMSSRTV